MLNNRNWDGHDFSCAELFFEAVEAHSRSYFEGSSYNKGEHTKEVIYTQEWKDTS